jgi:hypothetical protein
VSSLRSFRLDFPFHLKLFSFLLGCILITELSVWAISNIFHIGTNVHLYNISMGIQYWLYGLFFRFILAGRSARLVVDGFLILFPLLWLSSTLFLFGLYKWNSYVAATGSLFCILFSVFYFYQVFAQVEPVRFATKAELWIAIGLFVFYSINLPYIGMLNFLSNAYREFANKLLVVLQISNILMYSLFTYAYVCRMSIRK